MHILFSWVLVFHILGFVFWIMGLLATTTLLALHAEEPSPDTRQTLKKLELKFMRGSAHPGAAIAVLAGAALVALHPAFLHQHWLHAKLGLVAVLIALDVLIYRRAQAFHQGRAPLTRRECMFWHGAVSLAFLCILILVLVRPF
jgi:protoporphyrinogen IX oxidase